MKKILTILLAITLAFVGSGVLNQQTVSASGTSVCSTAPTLISVEPDLFTINHGDEVTLRMIFEDDCRHPITQVNLNGTAYTHEDFDGFFTSDTIYDYYNIDLTITYDNAMGGYFYVSSFQYSDWSDILNMQYYIINTAVSSEPLTVFDDGVGDDGAIYYIPLADVDTVSLDSERNLVYTYSDGTTAMTIPLDTLFSNTETEGMESAVDEDGNTFWYDATFISTLVVNGVGDLFDFAIAPAPLKAYYVYEFVEYSMANLSENDNVTDFAFDMAYDLILSNNGISDLVLNRATFALVEEIQKQAPEYVFPNDYKWIDGELQAIEVDENGDAILDSEGNPIIDEDGGTYGPGVIPEPVLNINKYIEQATTSLFSLLGIKADPLSLATSIQKAINFISNNWVLIILAVVLILTSPIWMPFLPIIIDFFKTFFMLTINVLITLTKGLLSPFIYLSRKAKDYRAVKNE